MYAGLAVSKLALLRTISDCFLHYKPETGKLIWVDIRRQGMIHKGSRGGMRPLLRRIGSHCD